MTKEKRQTEKESEKNTSRVTEKSIDTDRGKRAGRLAYKADDGSTLERRSSDPKSGVQSQGVSLQDSLGIAHDGWRLSAGEGASDNDRREQDQKRKKMDREQDRDTAVIKVHVNMKLLKGVMEANSASLDSFPERKALVDEIYVLGRYSRDHPCVCLCHTGHQSWHRCGHTRKQSVSLCLVRTHAWPPFVAQRVSIGTGVRTRTDILFFFTQCVFQAYRPSCENSEFSCRRITVLEDLFNEQVRPMRDLVSTLIRAANSDLDDTEILVRLMCTVICVLSVHNLYALLECHFHQ